MNPHRLTWGFAWDFPFSQLVAVTLLLAFILSREPRRMPWNSVTIVWLIFFAWTYFTTLLALAPNTAAIEWSRWWKINLLSLLTLLIINDRRRLQLLVWVIVISLGFYGIKGGLWTLLTGGKYMVLGPQKSFIGGNTVIGLALVMVLPLMRYLQLCTERRLLRIAWWGAIGLTTLAIFGTHSRGAFLAIVAVGAWLALKSPRRVPLLLAMAIMTPAILNFMPQHWYEKMETIERYEEDGSAMGRINAWWFAFNLAKDRPITGGGFRTFQPSLFNIYAPDPDDFHDAHSIYFEVLAEQGFVGLALYLTLGILAFRAGSWTIRTVGKDPELQWARNLSAMLQVSLVGYAVSGAFLGLAYFDLYYTFIVILVVTKVEVQKAIAETSGGGQPSRTVWMGREKNVQGVGGKSA